MGRRIGSKDKGSRKTKVFVDSVQERRIVCDYNDGMTSADIRSKYGISNSQLSRIRRDRGVKVKLRRDIVDSWKIVRDFKDYKETSGIYAIYFIWNYNKEDDGRDRKVNDIKAYVGSSVSVGDRLISHDNELSKNKHFNKGLQDRYNDCEFSVRYAIIEECSEDKIMQKEGEYLDKWNMDSLFNTWKPKDGKEIGAWLEKAITLDSYTKGYTISRTNFYNGTACQETKSVHKSGYGRIKATIDGVTKHFTKHRVAYWREYGEYVELVRHLCGNPKCYNPKHLAEGNHRQNGLDKRGDFPEEFERKWVECGGDLNDISQYFASKGRWTLNQDWKGHKVSFSVYEWEKKLGLRNKYPEIVKNRGLLG